EVVVVVPRLAFAVPDLDEADAFLKQTPRDQDLPRLHAGTVHVANVARLTAHIEGVFGVALHAIGELERLDAGFELGVGRALFEMALVELLQEIELLALLFAAD